MVVVRGTKFRFIRQIKPRNLLYIYIYSTVPIVNNTVFAILKYLLERVDLMLGVLTIIITISVTTTINK